MSQFQLLESGAEGWEPGSWARPDQSCSRTSFMQETNQKGRSSAWEIVPKPVGSIYQLKVLQTGQRGSSRHPYDLE
jgi:hypothetical protein